MQVRPSADDGAAEWPARLSELLGLAPGARVGVTAADPALAAAVCVRLAVSVAEAGRLPMTWPGWQRLASTGQSSRPRCTEV